jgi:hypothetical protein
VNSRRIIGFSSVVILVLGLLGWGYYRMPARHPVRVPAELPEPPDLIALRDKGYDLFLRGRYRLAAEVYRKGATRPRRTGNSGRRFDF